MANSRRALPISLALLVLFACAAGLSNTERTAGAQRPRGASTRLAPPPAWDERILQLFFSDAREHLGPGEPPPLVAPVAAVRPTPQPMTVDTTPAEAGFAWSQLVERDVLEDEVKSLAPTVQDEVQNASRFKSGGYQVARREFSLLAILFGVIADYDGDVRWQEQAAGMRDAFSRAGYNSKVASDAAFKEASLRADDLAQLVRGGTPDVAAGEPSDEWPAIADRRPLMSRLEVAQRQRLEPWLSSEQELSQHQADVLHEAQIIALLSQIIEHPGYEFGDDETYREYSAALREGARALGEAARQGNFEQARSALGTVSQSCDQCHNDFRS